MSQQADAGLSAHEPAREPRTCKEVSPRPRRALRVLGVTVLIVVTLLLLQQATAVFLLLFASILFAVFLRVPTNWLARKTPLSPPWALALVTLVLVALTVAAVALGAPRVIGQFDELSSRLGTSIADLEAWLQGRDWGQKLLGEMPQRPLAGRWQEILTHVGAAFSGALGVLANLVIVFFIGLFLASKPAVYENGVVRLVPPAKRARAREILDAIERTLGRWLVGRMISMTAVGVVTAIGLSILGIPLAVTLGVLAGLLGFVPNIGPLVSAVPALLLAVSLGPLPLLYTALLYVGINLADGYLLTPLLQRRAVSLPPAVLLFAQLLMGVLLGTFGLLLATPLAASALVLVKMIYVEGVLGDKDGADASSSSE